MEETFHVNNYQHLSRLVRASSIQTAGSPLSQKSCSTSGHEKNFCTSVLASCGTFEHHQDNRCPELQHLAALVPCGPQPLLRPACKCQILKYLFLYLILVYLLSFFFQFRLMGIKYFTSSATLPHI